MVNLVVCVRVGEGGGADLNDWVGHKYYLKTCCLTCIQLRGRLCSAGPMLMSS